MNRRNAINNIVILSIGAVVLPSCGQRKESLVKFKNFSLSDSEEKMLGQLSDTIIPKTNFIGAADLKAHEFTLMMVDDCYEPERQKKYTAGMKEFDKLAKNKYGSSFTSCTVPQKKEWLTAIEKKKDIPENVVFFYETTKRHTVQAFTSSKEYMTDIIKYKMVPGSNFKGCVPVKKA
ncbi:MAG: gluconate 2-dehydrogenase subunit 3 family protein [Ferruginibacter sp.]